MSRGDPDAGHALAFVGNVADPEGLYTPQRTEAPIGRVVEIAYNGIKRHVRVTPMVASLPSALSPMTDGRSAGRSPVTPKPSWRPSALALGRTGPRRATAGTAYPATADDPG
jgi:hypothetical protein